MAISHAENISRIGAGAGSPYDASSSLASIIMCVSHARRARVMGSSSICTCGLILPNYQNCQFSDTIAPCARSGIMRTTHSFIITRMTNRGMNNEKRTPAPPQIDRSHGSYFMIKGCARAAKKVDSTSIPRLVRCNTEAEFSCSLCLISTGLWARLRSGP